VRLPKVTLGACALFCFLAWFDWGVCSCFLLCAFVHELGHLLAMLCCRVPIGRITIDFCGAVIEAVFPSYKTEFICAAAGPVAGVILGTVLLRLLPKAAVISFLLSFINLLPLSTLDGGRMLRSVLCICFDEESAGKYIRVVRIVVCCTLMLLACWGAVYLQMGLWPIFLALGLLWRIGTRD